MLALLLARGGAALLLDPALDVPLGEAPVATAAHRGQGPAAGGAIDPAPRHAQSLGDVVGISQAFGHTPYTDERGSAPLFLARAAWRKALVSPIGPRTVRRKLLGSATAPLIAAQKSLISRGLVMRLNGVEPSRVFPPTRPSTLRVYQFRHSRSRAVDSRCLAAAEVAAGGGTGRGLAFLFCAGRTGRSPRTSDSKSVLRRFSTQQDAP